MSAKRSRHDGGSSRPVRDRGSRPAPTTVARPEKPRFGESRVDSRGGIGLLVVVLVLIAIVVIGADYVFGVVTNSAGSSPTATPVASGSLGVVVPGNGGSWVDVSPDQLAGMLGRKDFLLVNVKTPYVGEIDGTDLYLPYDQISARAAELPANKGSKILVYCRSGVQSAQAAQTLLDLGYTNVWNLAGGMNAWQAAGRQLVTKSR